MKNIFSGKIQYLIYITILLFIIFLFFWSHENMRIKKSKNFGLIHVTIILYKTKYDHIRDNTLLFGSLIIDDKSNKLTYFNLDRIKIKIDKKLSKKIYIDSIGDILTYKYPFKNHKISTKVYWLFPGKIMINNPKDILIQLH